MQPTTHLHITSWALAIILLIVVLALRNSKKNNGANIVHMILRVDYLLILYSGGALLTFSLKNFNNTGELIVKTLAGLWAIVAIEMIAVRSGKKKSAKGAWIQLTIAVIITLALGFWRLPLSV